MSIAAPSTTSVAFCDPLSFAVLAAHTAFGRFDVVDITAGGERFSGLWLGGASMNVDGFTAGVEHHARHGRWFVHVEADTTPLRSCGFADVGVSA